MRRGPKRSFVYDDVVSYARENPRLLQRQIAEHFGSSQKTISRILRAAGIGSEKGKHQKGGVIKRRGLSNLAFEWETILHQLGLGMNRGISRLSYGRDYLPWDVSVTLNYAGG